MLGLSVSLFALSAIEAFSPLELSPLAWWDPSDPSTLFQDLAGIIPANIGDPVRLMLDKSGNGHDLTAPSDETRPILRGAGDVRWLESDGVDDRLEITSRLGLPADPALTICAAIEKSGADGADFRVFHLGSFGAGSIAGSVGIGELNGNSWRFNNGNRVFPPSADDAPEVLTWIRSSGSTYGEARMYYDAIEQSEVSNANPTLVPSDTGQAFTVFSQQSGNNNFRRKLHGMLVFDVSLGVADLLKVQRYLANKQGRSI
ncbi:hypothetical protein [Tritonibacter mobilis]|uniref:hypothetical protein n=1 Tax=Tritonibacter mobilis TaxID=379347 RepID=UPI001C09324D|nr:hypothetical protein [Tritonibacter mobilis]MBU3035941.1 hypothetical protein [Tritonibacter mobilis]WHQ85361.1 hypothetical protein OMR53_21775 [Tritonibacter mobilis]